MEQGGESGSEGLVFVPNASKKKSFKSKNFNSSLGSLPSTTAASLPSKAATPPPPTSTTTTTTTTTTTPASAPAPSQPIATSAAIPPSDAESLQAQILLLQKQLQAQNELLNTISKSGVAPILPPPSTTTTTTTTQQASSSVWAQPKQWTPPVENVNPYGIRSSYRSFSSREAGEGGDDSHLIGFKTKSEKQGRILKGANTEEGKRELEAQLFGGGHVMQGIDFNKYENIPVESSGRGIPEPLENGFEDAGLSENLLRNIRRASYLNPTPIQRHSIPMVLLGRDVMACAQTGSGKTAAFLFPIITRLEEGKTIQNSLPRQNLRKGSRPRALVLAPTRELASQIHDEALRFMYESKIRAVVVYGGAEVQSQTHELRLGCDVLVATPGRLVDLISRGYVSLQNVMFLVLDEADRMLDMGFEPQVREIVSGFDMPSTVDGRQTSMFSATFPKEIQNLAQEFLGDYIFVTVGRVGSTTTTIEQRVIWCEPNQKELMLMKQLQDVPGLTLVFVQTKRDCDHLENRLLNNGIEAAALHSDRSQREREYALHGFTNGLVRVLVATDIAARGLDVNDVAHVINYEPPSEIDTYVHRVGRTGRAGNKGIATTFFNENDVKLAPKLLLNLEEANQEIPSWLKELAASASHYGGGHRGGYGRRGGGGSHFAGKDVRSGLPSTNSSQQPAAASSSRGGRGGGRGGRRGGGGGANQHQPSTDAW